MLCSLEREKNTLNYIGLLLKSDCTESARDRAVCACNAMHVCSLYVCTLRASSTISG